MDISDAGTVFPPVISHCVCQSGRSVVLTVRKKEDRWALSVVGRAGQVSEWIESFGTAMDALIAGLTTLRLEGIADYFDDPVFGFLEVARSIDSA